LSSQEKPRLQHFSYQRTIDTLSDAISLWLVWSCECVLNSLTIDRFLHQVAEVLAANIRMKTLDRGVKMVYNPVAIILEDDKHRPSGLILNCIDEQMFADSICTRVALS
jgi:hypothetical protein